MSLTHQLAERREAARKRIPSEKLLVMDRATEELGQSGITASCLKEGDTAPDFVLRNAFGDWVSLTKMVKDGPVVLSFYRGGW